MATVEPTTNPDAARMTELDILARLEQVEQGLLTQDAMIPIHCTQILKGLQQYEELVHLMDDGKIRVLMQGMKTYRKVELVKEAAKTKSKGKGTTVDDI